jgi:hypothetical protein
MVAQNQDSFVNAGFGQLAEKPCQQSLPLPLEQAFGFAAHAGRRARSQHHSHHTQAGAGGVGGAKGARNLIERHGEKLDHAHPLKSWIIRRIQESLP